MLIFVKTIPTLCLKKFSFELYSITDNFNFIQEKLKQRIEAPQYILDSYFIQYIEQVYDFMLISLLTGMIISILYEYIWFFSILMF